MSTPTLGFEVVADTSAAESALRGLSDAAEGVGGDLQERLDGATESLGGLSKEATAAESALGGLSGAAEGVGGDLQERLDGATESLGDLDKGATGGRQAMSELAAALQMVAPETAMSGLAAALQMVNPEAATLVSTTGALTSGIGALGVAMGPAIIAAVGLTAVLAAYTYEQRRAAAAAEDALAVQNAMASIDRRRKETSAALAGALSEETRRTNELTEARRLAFIESSPEINTIGQQIGETREEIIQLQERLDRLNTGGRFGGLFGSLADSGAAQLTRDRINELSERLRSLTADRNEYLDSLREEANEREELVRLQHNREDEARATRNAAAAARELAQAEALRRQGRAELAKREAEVAAIQDQAYTATLSAEERIQKAYDDRMARLTEIARETQGGVDVAEAEAAVRRQRDQELHDLRMAQFEKERQARERADEEAARRAKERQQQQLATVAEAGQALGTLSGIAMQNARRQAEVDEEGARQSLGIAKALAAAEATAAFGVGIMNAIARNAGRPLATGVSIAAVTAAYAQQSAAISGISLHRGGFVDEVPATLRRGEAVLSNQGRAMMGDDEIRRANSGRSPSRDRVIVVDRYKNRVFNRFIADNLKAGGPLPDAIRDDEDTGYRGRHRGGS